jgi:hypothetical protein
MSDCGNTVGRLLEHCGAAYSVRLHHPHSHTPLLKGSGECVVERLGPPRLRSMPLTVGGINCGGERGARQAALPPQQEHDHE